MGGSQIGATALWQIAQGMCRGLGYHQTVLFKNGQNATKTGVFAGFEISEKQTRAAVVQHDEADSAVEVIPRPTVIPETPAR